MNDQDAATPLRKAGLSEEAIAVVVRLRDFLVENETNFILTVVGPNGQAQTSCCSLLDYITQIHSNLLRLSPPQRAAFFATFHESLSSDSNEGEYLFGDL